MKRIDFSSLRVRLLLIVILASIPAMVLTVNHAVEDRNFSRAQIQADTLLLTQLSASSQEEWIEGTRQLLVSLAQLSAVRNRDPAACSLSFADVHKSYSRYANIFAIAPDGDVFCSAIPMTKPVSAADRLYFKRAVSSRGFSIGDYQAAGRISGLSFIGAAYPVYDDTGNLAAVVAASLDLTWLNELAEKMQLQQGSSFNVIDEKGTIIARYPDPEKWVGQSMPEAGIVKMILSRHEGTVEAPGFDGIRRVFAYAPVYSQNVETGIFVSIGIPASIAYARINSILVRNLTWLSIAILLMLAVAWFGSDAFILRNLNALLDATRRLGAGDLSVRAGVPYNQGEVGELARIFDGMAESLQEKEKERSKAEEKLHNTLLYTRSLIEASLDPLVTISPEGKITDVNKAAESVTGVLREQLIGSDFLNYFTEPEKAREGYQHVFEKGFVKDYPLAIRHVSGSITDVLYNASVYRDADGIVAGVFAAARDITELKRAEGALRASEEKYKTLFESAGEGILIADIETKEFKYANPAICRMLGYSKEELSRLDLSDIHPKDALEYVISEFEAQARGEKILAQDIPCLRKDGTIIYTDINSTKVLIAGREYNLGFFTDITKRKQAEDKIKHYTAELERSNSELQQFAYIASHDLQEPLRMISSFMQLIERRYKGKLDKDADEFINFAVDGANRLQDMINGLLAYSRVETKGSPFQPTDCNAVIEETLANLKVAIEDSGADITYDSLPTVMADFSQLGQVFQNLISNAIKFRSSKQLEIHISARRMGNEWQFCVQDNGIGIDQKYKDRLFIIFNRLHGREYPGTGIGLAVCKRIVERHGGRIWLESETGGGSSFYFTIPERGGEINEK